jgi:transcriptional regulator with XRE-family HTH domain
MTQLSNSISDEPKQSMVPARESPDATLAKNLVAARTLAGITQQELADVSGISRATVAQIETGSSDPRLSTIVELAKAIGVPPILLLIGLPEVQALAELASKRNAPRPAIDSREVAKMLQYVSTGMLKDRLRAARVGADAVEAFSTSPNSPIIAGIFSAILPGAGTEVGARLGDLLAQPTSTIQNKS